MFKQRDAIVRLLKDDDPETIFLLKQQLAQGGAETIPDLRDLLSIDDEKVTVHIREILTEIEIRNAKATFEQICRRISTPSELEQACWNLAQIFLPGVEIESYQKTLDKWANELKTRLSPHDSESARVATLAQFFGRDLGFRGNADDYYSARNSLLPCVMDTRLGIPISLSVLYMIAAQRAAVVVEGINLPGHFVVRHGAILFDPFHEGRVLTTRDCAEILSHQKLTLHPSHLQAAHPRLILIRMLANLLYIFERDKNDSSHDMVATWIRLLDPK
jgi:regulator of sirC expression with transglutaminase-like and TPR domain